ncbi:peptidoglycan recognition protein family protein [Calycomorphotria hydatis]|uniref:N-acetylmuramoyl-L-alanine amidase n=1 Tax=Calycomorphotria hydatis TaxID=2528027 RepID=A0A517T554_9PLAN|nr:peptidoglycan recognition family protein [Calycomorphotria hydatis]QDT63499.1 N-acetylmuramoyl-L-alanine amidase [Calycomorphotria hydatis]
MSSSRFRKLDPLPFSAALLLCLSAIGGFCLAAEPSAVRVHRGLMQQLRKPVAQTKLLTPDNLDEALVTIEDASASHDWKYIVLHHTATNSGSVASIDAAHKRRRDSAGRPWKGIGYHFLIGNGNGMPDGKVAETFRWEEQIAGAHAGVLQYNQHGIGIALVGNFELEGPTDRQQTALLELIERLVTDYGIPAENILTHGEIRATQCPGRFFDKPTLLKRVTISDRVEGSLP